MFNDLIAAIEMMEMRMGDVSDTLSIENYIMAELPPEFDIEFGNLIHELGRA